jgi:hypothetical protein
MNASQLIDGPVCTRSAFAAAVFILLLSGATCQAEPLPLPRAVQIKVNKAVDDGVDFLKSGKWTVEMAHRTGYAALIGLTLLECGVPANHPVVQTATAFVRASARNIDTTYEISLSILFLDKLGLAADRPLIQKLALRLIAGQTPTGGWSYKCHILSDQDHKQLLSVLQKLNPPILHDPLANTNGTTLRTSLSMPEAVKRASQVELKDPIAQTGRRSAGDFNQRESAMSMTRNGAGKPDETRSKLARFSPAVSRNGALCIKMSEPARDTDKPSQATVRKVVIPSKLQGLPVFMPNAMLQMTDPDGKENVPIWGTSDNSNTQFAILALWAARRHQVPTERTLNLVAKRFHVSQNGDGSWGYHFRIDGKEPERRATTCVGLLGLAVAYGAQEDADVKALSAQDPRIIKGITALAKNVGEPKDRTENVPMTDLYFLWSVERVGVLFDLPTIGGKDWYRWGAEILLANQTKNGNWEKGEYHGNHPTIDTCLALLFLKRANLAADLTALIPFRLADITEAPKKIDPPVKEEPKVEPPKSEPPEAKEESAAPPVVRKRLAPAEPAEESGRNAGAWLLGILLLVIVLGIVLALVARYCESDDEADEVSHPSATGAKRKALN